MEKSFNLTIVEPENIVYQGKAVSLVAPCEYGYLGVLAGHSPLAAAVKSGKIMIKKQAGQREEFFCKGKGFLEVLKDNVTIILS